jgi:hypothetical protein
MDNKVLFEKKISDSDWSGLDGILTKSGKNKFLIGHQNTIFEIDYEELKITNKF